jgi:hypothetical protein
MNVTRPMKCVIVIDSNLPLGLLVNTAAVLSVTLGKMVEGIVGSDLADGSGKIHRGITIIPIPILKGTRDLLKDLCLQLHDEADEDVLVVDFCDVAQTSKTYDEYAQKLIAVSAGDIAYLGIALYGPAKIINRFTGSLALLR